MFLSLFLLPSLLEQHFPNERSVTLSTLGVNLEDVSIQTPLTNGSFDHLKIMLYLCKLKEISMGPMIRSD